MGFALFSVYMAVEYVPLFRPAVSGNCKPFTVDGVSFLFLLSVLMRKLPSACSGSASAACRWANAAVDPDFEAVVLPGPCSHVDPARHAGRSVPLGSSDDRPCLRPSAGVQNRFGAAFQKSCPGAHIAALSSPWLVACSESGTSNAFPLPAMYCKFVIRGACPPGLCSAMMSVHLARWWVLVGFEECE